MKKGIIAVLIIVVIGAFFLLRSGETENEAGERGPFIDIFKPTSESVWKEGSRVHIDYVYGGEFPTSPDRALNIVLRCDHKDPETEAVTRFVSQLATFTNTGVPDMSPFFDVGVPTDTPDDSQCQIVVRHSWTDENGERQKIEGVSDIFSVIPQ